MPNIDKICLFGGSFSNPNRGVNALTYGAIEQIVALLNADMIYMITRNRENKVEKYIIGKKIISIKIIGITRKSLIKNLLNISTPNKEENLRKILHKCEYYFSINEGDSYSDIYSKKRFIFIFLYNHLLMNISKKSYILPQTIGPFKNIIFKKLAVSQLRRFRKIFVREDYANMHIKNSDIYYEIASDLSGSMKTKRVQLELPNKFIGINISGLLYFNEYEALKGKYCNYRIFLTHLVDFFLNNDLNLMFIPHTYSTKIKFADDDLEATLSFIDKNYKICSNIKVINKEYTAQELKYIISQSDLFIGSRMHSCYASLFSGVPTVGLSYSPKFKASFRVFGVQDCVFEMDSIQKNEINENIEIIKNIYLNRSHYTQIIKSNKFIPINIKK